MKPDRNRYWRDEYFRALDLIQPVADAHSLTLAEIALRWIEHHSELSRERGDNVLIGASSVAHLEQNLADLEKGPLPDDGASSPPSPFASERAPDAMRTGVTRSTVLDALDKAWEIVKPVASLVRSPHSPRTPLCFVCADLTLPRPRPQYYRSPDNIKI